MKTSSPPPARRRWDWRPRLRWFAAEFLVVVSGVLVALALNAWCGDRQDAAEARYLALISRDLGQMIDELEELRAFEETQIEDGFAAYRAISKGDRSSEGRALVSDVVANLTLRRTMRLTNPAYQDLLSTGNLHLIQDPALRDQMVAFYERVEREYEIHHLNNASYVDDLFKDALYRDGLFVFKGPARSTLGTPTRPIRCSSRRRGVGTRTTRTPSGAIPTRRWSGRWSRASCCPGSESRCTPGCARAACWSRPVR